MSDPCSNVGCGNMTDSTCVCHRAVCMTCSKFSICRECRDNQKRIVTNVGNKLSLNKRRRVEPARDTDETNNPQPDISSDSLPDPEDVSSNSSTVVQLLNTQRKSNCERCNLLVMLRPHLHDNDECANYYRDLYHEGDVNVNVKKIVDKIVVDNRNRNRAQRRMEDRAQGNAREQRLPKRFQDCAIQFGDTIDILLAIKCVFCTSRFTPGKGIHEILDDDIHLAHLLDAIPERRNVFRFDNNYWRCNICAKMTNRLNENQVHETLRNILEVDDASQPILIMRYENEAQLHTVLFPKLRGAPDELPCSHADEEELKARVMIPCKLCRLADEEHIEPEVAEAFVNRTKIDPTILTSALFKDIDKKMKSAEVLIQESNETTKVGAVDNNVLNLQENKNSHDFFMKRIRCTEAYQKMLISENLAKQDFNGKQSLAVDKVLGECNFERLLMDELNVPFVVKYITNDNGSQEAHELIPCILEENMICDVTYCDEIHLTPKQHAQKLFPDGNYPEEFGALYCRYMQGVVQSFVSNMFVNLTEHYHLQTQFFEDGSLHLIGNIWIKELTPYNKSGEMLDDNSVIPDFYDSALDCKLLQEKKEIFCMEDQQRISEETERHLEMKHWENVKESKLEEFVWSSGRGFRTVWTDQAVVSVSVISSAYIKQLYRRKKPEGDELEDTHLDEHGEEWVLLPSMRVKFALKPQPIHHVVLGQFGGWYKKLDIRSCANLDRLKQDLSENNGCMGQSDVRIVTNQLRYPNELEFLPECILLNNGKIMKLRKKPAVISPTGRLDNLGMRILCEPFGSEQELKDEQRMFVDIPSIEILSHRLKEIYPTSNYDIQI